MDSQLYAEDHLAPTGLPAGFREELERKKLAALLTIDSAFPHSHLQDPFWKSHAVPHVNVGASPAPYRVYIDRNAFIDQALALARQTGRQKVALLERAEHYAQHVEYFRSRCEAHGLTPCPAPASWPSPLLAYEDYGYDLMKRVWNVEEKPGAIIVPDDVIAKGIAQAALALRIQVPQEVLIIAMTNRGARFFYPVPIVSFEVDVEALMAVAASMLIDLMNGVELPPKSILVPPVASFTGMDALETSNGGQACRLFQPARASL
jgi:DNA-binding LacI/PurR family transcriptional regulator